jgi:hypothetical protein
VKQKRVKAETPTQQAAAHVAAMAEPPSAAQAYALRVWAGQSESLSQHERHGRVRAALEAQGYSMEGVTLP